MTEIPPLEFAYFDPTRGEYAVARSKPIPLHVTASAELDARDLTNIKTEQRSPQSQAVETTDGLRGIEVREERLLASTPPITMPQVVAVALAPPFAALGIWSALALVRSSGANVAGRRRAAAATNARKRIDAAAGKPPIELSRQIEAALGEYLADRYNLPIGRTMGKAGVALLRERGIDEATLKLWTGAIERCEGALYGGLAAGDASLAQQASECIAAIERGKA